MMIRRMKAKIEEIEGGKGIVIDDIDHDQEREEVVGMIVEIEMKVVIEERVMIDEEIQIEKEYEIPTEMIEETEKKIEREMVIVETLIGSDDDQSVVLVPFLKIVVDTEMIVTLQHHEESMMMTIKEDTVMIRRRNVKRKIVEKEVEVEVMKESLVEVDEKKAKSKILWIDRFPK
mmetsp:Transcript_11134/g.16789  ORF Transcript_11134/g.16789 Transcript_11134/m.16789 type:complete len:175 (+) Transcript_11134:766-1290(+)